MLPPFIIENIRRREERKKERQEQPRLELPLPPSPPRRAIESDDDLNRGVIVIDLMGSDDD